MKRKYSVDAPKPKPKPKPKMKKESGIFGKLDDFTAEWLETVQIGLTQISGIVRSLYEFAFNLFLAIMALLILAFTSPFWILGKMHSLENQKALARIKSESSRQ